MQIKLESKPKNPIIVEGFPGFGLVGTIATEFLVRHTDAKEIGRIRVQELPPVVAVHSGAAIEPIGIFYSKKYNLLIIYALSSVQGLEWQLADAIVEIAKDLKAKEIISLEGVGSQAAIKESRTFYMSTNKKFKAMGSIQPLKEGIIMGVTGALLLQKDLNVTSLFAETHSALPDSRAAAKIIRALDQYLGLKVDYEPLLEKAKEFEDKIQGLVEKARVATQAQKKKEPNYFG
jgi:uncharacterized protein